MSLLKIDDVAKETGLTKRAIRYYEQIGLIHTPERSEGGTRLYSGEDIDRLKKVILAKEILGFSLQELQQFLDLHDTVDYYQNSTEKPGSLSITEKSELKKIYLGIETQIGMIDHKITKMLHFKEDLQSLSSRVQQYIIEEEKD
ncbi:MerR family transcriptional regulator [Metabacillus sp. RGM 3146]|uniref:MerR family transcriptional regulator n=1 Tax=Metabacillus sp. RGM 3146 TaxID=3401092 RepID=UPI003B9A5FE7